MRLTLLEDIIVDYNIIPKYASLYIENIESKRPHIVPTLKKKHGLNDEEANKLYTALAGIDPVAVETNGEKSPYIQTIIKWFNNGDFLPEDIYEVKTNLNDFIKLKQDPNNKIEVTKTKDNKEFKKNVALSAININDISLFDLRKILESLSNMKGVSEFSYLPLVSEENGYYLYRVDDFIDGPLQGNHNSKSVCHRAFVGTNWCVRWKGNFINYGPPYYMVVGPDDGEVRPIALFHDKSNQIKDRNNKPTTEKAVKPFANLLIPLISNLNGEKKILINYLDDKQFKDMFIKSYKKGDDLSDFDFEKASNTPGLVDEIRSDPDGVAIGILRGNYNLNDIKIEDSISVNILKLVNDNKFVKDVVINVVSKYIELGNIGGYRTLERVVKINSISDYTAQVVKPSFLLSSNASDKIFNASRLLIHIDKNETLINNIKMLLSSIKKNNVELTPEASKKLANVVHYYDIGSINDIKDDAYILYLAKTGNTEAANKLIDSDYNVKDDAIFMSADNERKRKLINKGYKSAMALKWSKENGLVNDPTDIQDMIDKIMGIYDIKQLNVIKKNTDDKKIKEFIDRRIKKLERK